LWHDCQLDELNTHSQQLVAAQPGGKPSGHPAKPPVAPGEGNPNFIDLEFAADDALVIVPCGVLDFWGGSHV